MDFDLSNKITNPHTLMDQKTQIPARQADTIPKMQFENEIGSSGQIAVYTTQLLAIQLVVYARRKKQYKTTDNEHF